MGKVVLVTGGAGYVGSHTVVELLNADYTVIVVDNCVNAAKVKEGHVLPPALERIQSITGKSLIFHELSLLDRQALTAIFSKYQVDVVIHLAALKAVGESVKKPLAYYDNNVTGTITLLEVMNEAGVKQLVFSSSATVYGIPQYQPSDESHPAGVGITNPYGQTKYICEQILKALAVSDEKWCIILLRFFNPVGAHKSGLIGEDPNGIPNNLVPYISQVAIGRRSHICIYGDDYNTPDGTGMRDYIHVVDLALGHKAALNKLFQPDFTGTKIYNLGTGKGISVLEMIKAFSKACGKEIPHEITGRREGDVETMLASCDLAEKELNWKATKGLEEMCKYSYETRCATML